MSEKDYSLTISYVFSEYHAVRISTNQNNSGYGQVSIGDTEFLIAPLVENHWVSIKGCLLSFNLMYSKVI